MRGSTAWSPHALPTTAASWAPPHNSGKSLSTDVRASVASSSRSWRDSATSLAGAARATRTNNSVNKWCVAAVVSDAASANRIPASVEKTRSVTGLPGANCWPITSSAITTSSWPATQKTSAPAAFKGPRRVQSRERLAAVAHG